MLTFCIKATTHFLNSRVLLFLASTFTAGTSRLMTFLSSDVSLTKSQQIAIPKLFDVIWLVIICSYGGSTIDLVEM